MNTPFPPTQPNPDDDYPRPVWEPTPTAPAYPVWPAPPASQQNEPVMTGDESRSYTLGDTRAEVQNQTYVDANGNLVRRRNITYDNENQRRMNLKTTLLNLSSLLTGALMTLLGLRFFFQLLGADAANNIVAIIYQISQPFILGFNGIFADYQLGKNGVFETATLIAMLMYLILAAGVQTVIRMVLAPRRDPQQSATTTQQLRRW